MMALERMRSVPWAALVLALSLAALAQSNQDKSDDGAVGGAVQGLKNTAESTAKAEIVKRELATLVQIARLSNPETAEKAAKEIADAVNRLEMNAKQTQAFFNRLKSMNRTEFANLVRRQGNGVLAYGQAIVKGEGRDIARIKAALARGGDEAGLEAVRLLRRLEDGAPVSKREIMSVLKKLPPQKSTTLLDAFRSEFKRGGPMKQQLADSLGTVVDGVFVFNDAVNIYYSDAPPEEKAAAATGKGVEYGVNTVGGVLVSATGGGLVATLIVGWTAGQVGELTKQYIGLQYDRQNAELKEQWAKLELRQMTIRRMLEIDRLIKAGQAKQALDLSRKLREFYEAHEDEIGDNALGERLIQLRKNVSEAERKRTALGYLEEACLPYERALASYRRGVSLTAAKHDAREARRVLERWASTYPELAPALAKARKLEEDIAQAIAMATPVVIVSIDGPPTVQAGGYAPFHLNAKGGIPYYCCPSGGGCGDSFATTYWEAPDEPGKATVVLTLRDDIGQTATAQTTIQVVDGGNSDKKGKNKKPEPGPKPVATGTAPPNKPPPGGSIHPSCQRARACCLKSSSSASDRAACNATPNTKEWCESYLMAWGC